MVPLLLLTCDCQRGPAGGMAGGFIPVPDGSEGTIHQWGIEGAQPEDKVRVMFVKYYCNHIQKKIVFLLRQVTGV